ncbi:phosphatidylinositol 3-kinase C2 domain-containing subunit gamma [Leptodactylus fuscus]
MDPPLHFGFADHVTSFVPGEQVPQFPAAPADHGGAGGVFGSAPPYVFGSAPPYVFGSAPPYVFGSAPPYVFGSAPHSVYDSTPSVVSETTPISGSALPDSELPWTQAPYGFVTSNWLEEQQSWFPTLPPCGEDEVTPPPPITGGFTIGFENYGEVSDPSVHYHRMDSPGEPEPAGADTRSLVGDQPDIRARGSTNDWRINLQEAPLRPEPELTAFCDAVCLIRQGYCASDRFSNPGRIWSVAVHFPEYVKDSEVEISVVGDGLHGSIQSVQRDSICVEDFIADILRQIPSPVVTPNPSAPLYPLLHTPSPDLSHDSHPVPPSHLYPSLQHLQGTQREEAEPEQGGCYLRICGLDEYLQPGFSLRSHVALQREHRIRLRCHIGADPQLSLARTVEDDQMELNLSNRMEHAQYWQEMKTRLFAAVTRYNSQAGSFLYNPLAGVGGVLDAVMDICYLLRSVETPEISDAVQNLRASAQVPRNWLQCPQMADPVQPALLQLSGALSRLISLYSRSFHIDVMVATSEETPRLETRSEFLHFRLHAVHNLPQKWTKSEVVFYVSCSVTYAGGRSVQR